MRKRADTARVTPPRRGLDDEVEIGGLGELIDRITPTINEHTGRRRAPRVFRGASRVSAPLLTSLAKLGGIEPPHTKVHLEGHLLRSYCRYARPFLGSANGWEILLSARHHGLPTRLLDWTTSVLVAAHFATLHESGEDAAIWQLDWQQVRRRFGLPELALTVEDLAERFGPGLPISELGDIESFAEAPFLCLVDPAAIHARIIAQAATFTLCSDADIALVDFLARHDLLAAMRRYVIRAPRVPLIRDQLDLIGVDERRLFPDLEGVTAPIRRYDA